jgi:hypothetical protein
MNRLTPKPNVMPGTTTPKTMVLIQGFGHRLISQQFPHGTIDIGIFDAQIPQGNN